MPKPDGKLTAVQFEIMQLLWDRSSGMTVGEIWDTILEKREVSRTTVLTLVDRLEKRGWLHRKKDSGVFHYEAAIDRQSTEQLLASDFMSEFFGGSMSHLVLSLLGSKRVSKSEVKKLKELLDMPPSDRKAGEKS